MKITKVATGFVAALALSGALFLSGAATSAQDQNSNNTNTNTNTNTNGNTNDNRPGVRRGRNPSPGTPRGPVNKNGNSNTNGNTNGNTSGNNNNSSL